MTCTRVALPGGGHAIVCTSGKVKAKRCKCGNPAPLLCDWKVPSRLSGTCDKPICATCATSPAPDKDLCQEHAKAFEEWKASR